MKTIIYPCTLVLGLLIVACQSNPASITAQESREILDSAKFILQTLMDAQSRDPKFSQGTVELFKHYHATDADVRHVQHGQLFTSIDSMFIANDGTNAFVESIEYLKLNPERYDCIILAHDAVSVTIPCSWKMKVKARPEYQGNEVLSFLLQRRHGRWLIIQSHVSDPRICEAIEALM